MNDDLTRNFFKGCTGCVDDDDDVDRHDDTKAKRRVVKQWTADGLEQQPLTLVRAL